MKLSGACPALLAGTAACDVKLSGADKTVPNLNGGLDGVYKVTACESGRPLFTRQKSPKNGAQALQLCCSAAEVAPVCVHQPAGAHCQAGRLAGCCCQCPVPMQHLLHLSPKAAWEACSVRWWVRKLEQQGSSEHATRDMWHTASAVLHSWHRHLLTLVTWPLLSFAALLCRGQSALVLHHVQGLGRHQWHSTQECELQSA